MKRLLLPALLLLSSPAWADIAPPDRAPSRPADPKPPSAEPEGKGRSGCAAAMSLSLTLAALGAGWLLREKRRTA